MRRTTTSHRLARLGPEQEPGTQPEPAPPKHPLPHPGVPEPDPPEPGELPVKPKPGDPPTEDQARDARESSQRIRSPACNEDGRRSGALAVQGAPEPNLSSEPDPIPNPNPPPHPRPDPIPNPNPPPHPRPEPQPSPMPRPGASRIPRVLSPVVTPARHSSEVAV